MTSSQPDQHGNREELLQAILREMRLMSSFDALFSQAVAERAGMHSTDIDTLDLLNVLGPMTAGRLSEMTGLSTGATTRLIDRLERAGLAHRLTDDSDRRRVIVESGGPNAEAIGAYYVPLVERLASAWDQFSRDELAMILRFVEGNNAAVAAENARIRRK